LESFFSFRLLAVLAALVILVLFLIYVVTFKAMSSVHNSFLATHRAHVVNVRNSLSCDSFDFSSPKSFQHSTRAVDLSGFCIGCILSYRFLIVANLLLYVLNFESFFISCTNCPLFIWFIAIVFFVILCI